VKVAYDVTALLGARTGVGVVTGELLERLATDADVELVAYAVTLRGHGAARDLLPPGVRLAGGLMAAQPLRRLWRRADWPSITRWTGAVDVVHGPNFVVPPARGAAELFTVHDLTCMRYPELCTSDVLQYPDLMRRALRRGAHVHAVSQFVADEVIAELAAEPERVHAIPNGLTPRPAGDQARGRRRAGGERYVLAIGTIEPRKDLPSLVRAFDDVAGDDPDLRLVVAGQDGWGVDDFNAAVAAARHRDRVVRLGFVSDDERADVLAGATAFAFPSVYEGFGLPPLEAMAAGVPVVTTRTGAIPETVGDAAILVEPGDRDGLVAALVTATSDEAQRATLIERGRARAARYSWDDTAASMVRLYRSLC
jgi:glycosyltransferase involved in cell wall biosynthesis